MDDKLVKGSLIFVTITTGILATTCVVREVMGLINDIKLKKSLCNLNKAVEAATSRMESSENADK